MKKYINLTLEKSLMDFYLKFNQDEFESYHLDLIMKRYKAKGEDLSEKELYRKRFRRDDDMFNIGTRWGEKITLYYTYIELIAQGKSEVYNKEEVQKFEERSGQKLTNYFVKLISTVFSSNIENFILSNDEIIKSFSEVSTYFKKYGFEQYGLCSFLFVNLEMLGDYAPPDIDNAKQGLIRWLVEDKEIECDDIIREYFYTEFVNGLKDFLLYDCLPSYDLIKLSDFVEDVDLWGTGGTVGMRDKLIDREIKKHHQMTKKSYGLMVDKKKLYYEVINTTEQKLKINIKQELTKSRGVVNSDLNTYLLMAHIMYYMDKHMLGNPKSMQYIQGSDKVDKFYKQMFNNIDRLNFPMDQSNFDANVTGRMITLALDQMIEYLETRMCSSVTKESTDILKRIILGGDIKAGDKHYRHKSGIPSGWRMTAFLDSIINYAEIYAVTKLTMVYNKEFKELENIVVQGDDVSCVVGSKNHAKMIVYTFDKLGLMMNEKKISINYKRSEFLRHIYFQRDKTLYQMGYAVRQIPTLLYAKPDDKNRITINSIISNWSKFVKRLGLYNVDEAWNNCIYNVFDVIKSRNKRNREITVPIENVREYIFGPSELECYNENTIFSQEIKNKMIERVEKGQGCKILKENKHIKQIKKFEDRTKHILNKEKDNLKELNNFHVLLNNENYFSTIIHKGQKESIIYTLDVKYINETNYIRKINYKDITLLETPKVKYRKINTVGKIKVTTGKSKYNKAVNGQVYYNYIMNKLDSKTERYLYNCGIELTLDFQMMKRATRNFLNTILIGGENIYPVVHRLIGDNLSSLCMNNYITWLKYDTLLRIKPTMGMLRWLKSDINTQQLRIIDIVSSE